MYGIIKIVFCVIVGLSIGHLMPLCRRALQKYLKSGKRQGLEKRYTELQTENEQLKESIRYAIGGIAALLPRNKDVLAIKETLEQALKESNDQA